MIKIIQKVIILCNDGMIIIPSNVASNCETLNNAMIDTNKEKEYVSEMKTFKKSQIQNFLNYEGIHKLNHKNLNYWEKLVDYVSVADYLEYEIPNCVIEKIADIFGICSTNKNDKFTNAPTNLKKLLSIQVPIQQELFYYKTLDKLDQIKKLILQVSSEEKHLQSSFYEQFEKEKGVADLVYNMKKLEEYEKVYDFMLFEIFAKFVDKDTKEKNIKQLLEKYLFYPIRNDKNLDIVYAYVRNYSIFKPLGYNVEFYFKPYEALSLSQELQKFYNYPNNILFSLNNGEHEAIGLLKTNNKIDKIKFRSNEYLYLVRNNFKVSSKDLEYIEDSFIEDSFVENNTENNFITENKIEEKFDFDDFEDDDIEEEFDEDSDIEYCEDEE